MKDADLPSINLDELRLVPDWLKENPPAPSKQYASYDRPIEADDQNRRGPRPGGSRHDRRDSRDNRGPRDGRGGPGRPDRPLRGAPPGRHDSAQNPREGYATVPAAPIRVEFLPDERCMASIIKQIRTTHLAYPLFSLARMFLQEPARHDLQLSLVPGTTPPGTMLYQLGDDGPVTMDRAPLEAGAFEALKDKFYREESVQKDPPKGNFTNVARERLSGTLLGPTNYHGYQPALRALYESRYSRRMNFEDFRRNIEISSDPALVERWKEEARTVTTISTVDGEPPAVFTSLAEARAHFRQHHLEAAVQRGMGFRLHGSGARRLPEPAVMQAIREAHERELRYPAQFVQLLRQGLQNAGLHLFKHRKRIVYVAASRPTPFIPSSGAVTENVSLILATIAESPLCTRKTLADRVLSKTMAGKAGRGPGSATAAQTGAAPAPDAAEGIVVAATDLPSPAENRASGTLPAAAAGEAMTPLEAPAGEAPAKTLVPEGPGAELAKAKTALAADLRFLVQAGHIIEFHNGTFDLPLLPRPKEEPAQRKTVVAAGKPEDPAQSIGADPVAAVDSTADFAEPDAPAHETVDHQVEVSGAAPISEDSGERLSAVASIQEDALPSAEPASHLEAANGSTRSLEMESAQARAAEE